MSENKIVKIFEYTAKDDFKRIVYQIKGSFYFVIKENEIVFESASLADLIEIYFEESFKEPTIHNEDDFKKALLSIIRRCLKNYEFEKVIQYTEFMKRLFENVWIIAETSSGQIVATMKSDYEEALAANNYCLHIIKENVSEDEAMQYVIEHREQGSDEQWEQ